MKAIILTIEKESRMNARLQMVKNEILGKQMIDYCRDMLKDTRLFSKITVLDSVENIGTISEEIFVMKANAPLVLKETVIDYHEKYMKGESKGTPAFVFVKSGGNVVFEVESVGGEEFLLVNNKIRLYKASEVMKKRINENHMLNGVTIINPEHTYISPDVVIGCDTIIYPNTHINGNTKIGEGCHIGPDCSLSNMSIGNDVEILYSNAVDSTIGNKTHVGPYAYIRPNSQIGEHVKIGDFVEIKNSVIGNNSKASHLTYIGDAIVGKNVNFGCGTITVNYDGKKKFKTEVGDNAFIGSNSSLVAPVKVGEFAYAAAGSTITDDIPDRALAIARARQTIKLNWKKK